MSSAADDRFYSALSEAARCDSARPDERRAHLDALAAHHRQLQVWAESCPEHFENRSALVGAEIARIEGRALDAMDLYEQAIRSARANGFVHNEAVANELAGRFYLDRGLEKNGHAHLHDARAVDRDTFGPFDAVASLGAFEHFCSPDEFRAGRQEEIYRGLFENVATVLPPGGRFYLQTMVFGRNMIPLDEVDIGAPRDSDAWYLALMGRQFPGSWLPLDAQQVVRCAEPGFRLLTSSNGRLDYIQTITEWGRRTGARSGGVVELDQDSGAVRQFGLRLGKHRQGCPN